MPRQFSQTRMRQLRDQPDPALVDFVKSLVRGRWYSTTEAWEAFNGKAVFPDGATFRYAFLHAGGDIAGKRVRRPEVDGL